VVQRGDACLDVTGGIIDLRKRGFVPTGGLLQTAGIVHDMKIQAVVDPVARKIASFAADQPSVAFEPSQATRGECCRDPVDRLGALAGVALGRTFPRELSAVFGGPLGCSHLMALAQLFGSTLQWALDLESKRPTDAPERVAGDRMFRRDLQIDASETASGDMQIAIQLTDIQFASVRGIVSPMDQLAGQLELHVSVEIDLHKLALRRISAARRDRTPDDFTSAEWRDCDVAELEGEQLMPGVGRRLIERYGRDPDDRPLLDVLLNLTPGMHQAMAVLGMGFERMAKAGSTLMGVGGVPGSCYMWRTGGALDALRRASETRASDPPAT
jgi:hypothetical protein